MKLREELETSIGDGALVLAMLERLGFRVWFRSEKYREEFALADVVIAIDETPSAHSSKSRAATPASPPRRRPSGEGRTTT